MISLKNQVALITGGSRGIGAATAIMLARAGANVAITYNHDLRAAAKIVDTIDSMGNTAMAFRMDLSNPRCCPDVALSVHKLFGRIDILVNCAGVWKGAPLKDLDPGLWSDTLAINLDGTYAMCRGVVPIMLKRRYGRIINISSTAGQRGEAGYSNYAAAKGAIIAFTKSIAVELIREGIWVNAIAPGWVETDMIASVTTNSRELKRVVNSIPRGKIGTPEEIAGAVLFLASDLSNNIVGEVINANGGSVLCG